MTTLIFYEKPGCANNARQKRLLLEAGHELIVRDLLREPWTPQRLWSFFEGLPVAEWFNPAAPQVKSGAIDPTRVGPSTALEMMLRNPLLIRRPLIEGDGWRMAGFDPETVSKRLSMAGAKPPAGLETCPRPPAGAACPAARDGQRAETVLAYHERTKHRSDRYAAGPETLDWSCQPDPFRTFKGSPTLRLPLCGGRLATSFASITTPAEVWSPALSLASLGALLELSLGLSAWKEYGPDRWALRCNPSSGNLHPTEAYVIAHGIPGLDDGLYHYTSRSHALEQRWRMAGGVAEADHGLWIGLTSIHLREAWKYGERAFRYCQLDVGHALAALRYAAGVLGWQLRVVADCGHPRLARLLGIDRPQDFSRAELEDADLLVQVLPQTSPRRTATVPAPWPEANGVWMGEANILDPHPMYSWPVIDEVAAASEKTGHEGEASAHPPYPPATPAPGLPATQVILGRRSAQRFDPQFILPAKHFHRLMDSLLPRPHAPWDVWDYGPRIHPVLFVHRVEGVAPGLYCLVRAPHAQTRLRTALSEEFEWEQVEGCPAHLPLFRLKAGRWHKVARAVSCQQAIAAESCFSLGMLAEFEPIVRQEAWRYRQLHWEAGLLGHVLYLEAETLGLRGTGIGCFLDDAFHELLGLRNRSFQSLYHFTVGRALTDSRITTLPPYANLESLPDTESTP